MIREAIGAGLEFDPEKLVEMGVWDNLQEAETEAAGARAKYESDEARGLTPDIRIDIQTPSPHASPKLGVAFAEPGNGWGQFNFGNAGDEEKEVNGNGSKDGDEDGSNVNEFHDMIHRAHLALIHDSLEYGCGLSKMQVFSWKIMEYMPFRRMDLQADGSWKPIRWPLPCGETRDVPDAVRVHGSVIRRMKMDPTYRPGNLIVGGGGRGTRRAPDSFGIGEWECIKGHGDPISEVWVKKPKMANGSPA